MKTRCLFFLLLLTLIALPGLTIFVVTSEADAETAESKDPKVFDQYNRLVQIAEDVLTRLNKGSLQNREDALRAIPSGLAILKEILKADKRHAQELGFLIDKGTTEDILKDIIMGSKLHAYPVFEIRLNDLRAFSPGSDVEQLLFYTNQLLLSIGADKGTQTSLTIRFLHNEQDGTEQKPGTITWRPTRWGRPNLIDHLTKAQHNRPLGFLVSIPSLNKNFLGYKDETVIKLVPLAKDHLLTEGQSYLAEDVFTWLSVEAKSVDNSPR